MREICNPKDRRGYVIVCRWLFAFFILSGLWSDMALSKIYVDDPNPTPTSLKSYEVALNGEPKNGIDYSGNPVHRSDPRLHFREKRLLCGTFEKKIQYHENGEHAVSFNLLERQGFLPAKFEVWRNR